MAEQRPQRRRLITAEMLQDLPEPVQRYLNTTGVVGTPWIETVHLRQVGTFRQGMDRPWMPMMAEEWYTTEPPSFTWQARFKLAGLPMLRALDQYQAGHGHMVGKLAGLITVFDLRGEALDQATMLRYLNEMMWFPGAFLGDNITWEEVDDRSAKVTLTDLGKSVSATLCFDPSSRLTNFSTLRYRQNQGQLSLDPWSTPITGYGVHAGLNLPVKGQAVWNLPEGDLVYADLEVTDLTYNTGARP